MASRQLKLRMRHPLETFITNLVRFGVRVGSVHGSQSLQRKNIARRRKNKKQKTEIKSETVRTVASGQSNPLFVYRYELV